VTAYSADQMLILFVSQTHWCCNIEKKQSFGLLTVDQETEPVANALKRNRRTYRRL